MSELSLNPSLLLRFLGTPAIERAHGRLSGAAGQRHPIALLALLARAPGGILGREKLIGLLWPESESGNARNLLSVAVHRLRKSLGDHVLVAEGDAIRLTHHALRIDVLEFEAGVASGDFVQALEWYRGPFLDGFALPDAVDFERWQEDERERLRRLAAKAASELAEREQANGSFEAALRAARRALDLDCYDEPKFRSLLTLLDQTGDRAGAVREYDAFRARLATDLEVEPSPETQALVNAIRSRGERLSTATTKDRNSERDPGDVSRHAANPTDTAGAGAEAAPPVSIAASDGQRPSTESRPASHLRRVLRRIAWPLTAVAALAIVSLIARGFFGASASPSAARRQLTFSGVVQLSSVSPSGQSVAYVVPVGNERGVIVQEIGGDVPDTLITLPLINSLEWSPDNTRLLAGSPGRAIVLPRRGGAARDLSVPAGFSGPTVGAYWFRA